MIATNSLRAFDRIFDSMSRMHGFRNPLDMSTSIIKDMEANTVINDPVTGTYTVYEMVPHTYQVEKQESGDIVHRLLTTDEVEALKTQKVEKKTEVE